MKVRIFMDGEFYTVSAYRDLPTLKTIMSFLGALILFGVGLALMISLLSLLLPLMTAWLIVGGGALYLIVCILAFLGRFYGLMVNCPRCHGPFLLHHGVKRCPHCRTPLTLDYEHR